jgi:hypothetical protein
MVNPFLPGDDLLYDILAIVTHSRAAGGVNIETVEGTGFLVAPSTLVTCWHCLEGNPPPGSTYAVTRKTPLSPAGQFVMRGTDISGISRCRDKRDLATAQAGYSPSLGFKLASQPLRLGEEAWTFGYSLPDVHLQSDGSKFITLHPRLLRGHMTRALAYPHPFYGDTLSYELSFSIPSGLSGAPLFRGGTFEVVGVVYGNNDTAAVEEVASVDPVTKERRPEILRIVSFGLAHHLSSLRALRGIATGEKSIGDIWKTQPPSVSDVGGQTSS